MEFGNERRLILLCSKATLSESECNEIKNILANNIDWKEVLFQAVTHRTLNLLYYHLRSLSLLKGVEQEVKKLMDMNYKLIGIRNRAYLNEFGRIANEFNKRSIRAVVLKGMLLSSTIYPEIETRYFNDIDFLVKKSDISEVTDAITSLGFVQGQYNESTDKIEEASKKQKMFHQMTTHELQEFLKKSDNPLVKLLEVDINHNILWVGNCPYEVDHDQMINRALEVNINGSKAFMLSHEDCIVQLCCHLYKEATILHWIKDLKDLKIYKFADIQIYIDKYMNDINWSRFLKFVKENKLEKVIYYVFYYVNLMYKGTLPEELMREIEPQNKDFLEEYGIENNEPSRWNFDFFTRLFDVNRVFAIEQIDSKDFYSLKNQL